MFDTEFSMKLELSLNSFNNQYLNALKDGLFDGDYELEYKFDVQSLLLFYQGIFSYSALENITGINQKQLSHYAAGRSKPRKQQSEKIAKGLKSLAEEMMCITL